MIISEPKAQPSHNEHTLFYAGGGYLDSPAGPGGQTSTPTRLHLPFNHLLSRSATLNITQLSAKLVVFVQWATASKSRD